MLTIKNKIDNNLIYQINKPYNINDTIFFDIETTGLSAKTSYVYLIGCMYYENKSWYIIQWLLDDPKQEAKLLELLSNKLKTYKRIIHYNGDSFDIPFLRTKYKKYNLTEPFSNLDSLDLYREIAPYKQLFPFSNLKLKTLEKHLGINRQDKYSGGELINIYSQFIGRVQYEKLSNNYEKLNNKEEASKTNHNDQTSSNELAHILLLHNYEDLSGLLYISSIISYIDFLNNGIREERILEFDYKASNSKLYINLELTDSFPYEIEWILAYNLNKKTTSNLYDLIISLKEKTSQISIPLTNNKLKIFYENYKDYYYLPQEDMAIHKSVAMYVDKDFRVRANSANCYSYVELDTILSSKKNLISWCNSLLGYIISNKKSVIVKTCQNE